LKLFPALKLQTSKANLNAMRFLDNCTVSPYLVQDLAMLALSVVKGF